MSNSVDSDEMAHEPSHLNLCCLQKPIIIDCGSERVKATNKMCSPWHSILFTFFIKNKYWQTEDSHDISKYFLWKIKKKIFQHVVCCRLIVTLKVKTFVCVEVLRPVNPMGSCRARSVYLTTRLLGRLSPLSG